MRNQKTSWWDFPTTHSKPLKLCNYDFFLNRNRDEKQLHWQQCRPNSQTKNIVLTTQETWCFLFYPANNRCSEEGREWHQGLDLKLCQVTSMLISHCLTAVNVSFAVMSYITMTPSAFLKNCLVMLRYLQVKIWLQLSSTEETIWQVKIYSNSSMQKQRNYLGKKSKTQKDFLK